MSHLARQYPYLSRRGFLFAGGTALTSIGALPAADPACTLTSEKEEGPYYLDDETLRRDITEQRPGVPLLLNIRVVDSKNCAPLGNAAIDLWHCDAVGVYSGFTAHSPDGGPGDLSRGRRPGPPPEGFGGGFRPGPPPGGFPGRRSGAGKIDPTRFLRGVQLTGREGLAEFSTLYPGWYSGRAIHIHLKVHLGGTARGARYSSGHVAHTGQLFLPEDLTDRVARLAPYSQRLGIRRTLQEDDGIFRSQNGSDCLLKMERLGKKDEDGYRATVTLAVDPERTPAPVRGFSGPPSGRRRSAI